MKRRLVVMRHAKSSWADPGMPDHNRPLNKRGQSDAPRMAQELVSLGWAPDLILSSDATRTQQTYILMAPHFPNAECKFFPDLYHSGVREVVSLVSRLPDQPKTVMLLGHNPGWEHVVQYLSGQEVTLKTATAALLEIDAEDWNEAIRSAGSWKLVDVLYPRELEDH